jgi:hypothetical protein
LDVAGTITVPDATASNEPVALAQLVGHFGNVVTGSGTSATASVTYTPPQNGLVLVNLTIAFSTGTLTGNNVSASGGTILSGSGSNAGNTTMAVGSYLYTVTANTAFTITPSATNSSSSGWEITILGIFIPTP